MGLKSHECCSCALTQCLNPHSVLVSRDSLGVPNSVFLNPSALASRFIFVLTSLVYFPLCSFAALNVLPIFCDTSSPLSLQVGTNLNHDEVVVYNEDAAIPTYVIVYTMV